MSLCLVTARVPLALRRVIAALSASCALVLAPVVNAQPTAPADTQAATPEADAAPAAAVATDVAAANDAARTAASDAKSDASLAAGARLPELLVSAELATFRGKPVRRVVWREQGSARDEPLTLQRVASGEPFSAAVARRALRELLDSGRYATLSAQVEALPEAAGTASGGLLLRLTGLSRKVAAEVRVQGGLLDEEATLNVAQVSTGTELTAPELPAVAARVRDLYVQRGFPNAAVNAHWIAQGDATRVVLVIDIVAGPARQIVSRRFAIAGTAQAELGAALDEYALEPGQRADEHWLLEADKALAESLRRAGWFEAHVAHRVQSDAAGARLTVDVTPGQLFRVRVEGNRTFDESALLARIDPAGQAEPSATLFAKTLQDFYWERGFLDSTVRTEERREGAYSDLVLVVQENAPVRVAGRSYPCLRGQRSTAEVNSEIDGVLGEVLPGGNDWFGPASPADLDRALGTPGGQRAELYESTPWQSYVPSAYEKAVAHLRDLYRAEGYLSAVVGPVAMLRRACSPLSKPGQCEPVGVRVAPDALCPSIENPLPVEDPPPRAEFSCKKNPLTGASCEPNVVLSIPVKLGPRTLLWDIQFAGNEQLLGERLAEVAELNLGAPVSQVELQKARRRILDLYADEGYAFASVDVELLLSQDQTRGSARFVISEREQVEISQIIVRGAGRTQQSLILSRLELVRGGIYKRHLVRQSEEQLATLGVFASVAISLEDPEVPAKRKVVLVLVSERLPQYVDIKPGFSTGEGARIAFEYGHRNLAGRAISLRLRVQLGYLPGFLIFEDDVRENFEALSLANRLERRDTATLEFPIAKRYRFAIEGVDARDNSRDFGITKRAFILTLTHRPSRSLSLVGSSSFELNDARVFGDKQNLQEYLEANPEQVRLLNAPEGRSFAVALRAGGTWDRTDAPLSPTRGTLLTLDVEPVVAYLDEDSAAVQLEACQGAGGDPATCEYRSRFLKLSGRIGGYIPFNDSGFSLALNLRMGANLQLVDNSSTYPDRLFFMGGADSLRGFLQASLIPQDIADRLQPEDPTAADQNERLTARKVVIRGGDFLINPRMELRIPLSGIVHTALFLDTGNLWRDIDNVDATQLRYTAGTGLRIVTPVGPLAFDYGIKLDRRFYESDLGAFHFSIGLY